MKNFLIKRTGAAYKPVTLLVTALLLCSSVAFADVEVCPDLAKVTSGNLNDWVPNTPPISAPAPVLAKVKLNVDVQRDGSTTHSVACEYAQKTQSGHDEAVVIKKDARSTQTPVKNFSVDRATGSWSAINNGTSVCIPSTTNQCAFKVFPTTSTVISTNDVGPITDGVSDGSRGNLNDRLRDRIEDALKDLGKDATTSDQFIEYQREAARKQAQMTCQVGALDAASNSQWFDLDACLANIN